MEYPKDLLQIQVLDDSTDDTAPFAEALVERYRTWGIPSSTTTAPTATDSRPARCRQGLKTATGEFVAVFDADFCPPPIS